MSDLIFSRVEREGLDLIFGDWETASPEEILGEYDLLFSTPESDGFDLEFGHPSSGEEVVIPPLDATALLKLWLPKLHGTASNIPHFRTGEVGLYLSLPYLEGIGAYDINTFRGFTRGATTGFTEAHLIYDHLTTKLQEAEKVVVGFSTSFQTPLVIKGTTTQSFQEAYTISRQVITFFEVGQPVKETTLGKLQEAEGVSRRVGSLFEKASSLSSEYFASKYESAELVGDTFSVGWQTSSPLSRRFGFDTHYSQVVNKSFDVFYQTAEFPINVQPPVILPPKPPEGAGKLRYDLIFDCPLQDEGFDLIFNNCGSSLPPLVVDYTEPYFVINSIELINIETGEVIQATAIDFSTDQSSYAWSGTFTVADEELPKLVADSNNPVLVSVTFNGNLAVFMVQSISRAATFNKSSYKVSIISPTALLDSPYSRTDSKTVTEDAAPQTLIEERLTSELTGITLNWQYLSPLDWVVAANTFTYQELSPIKAIGKLLEGSAAFMSSSLDGTELVVKRKRVNEFWEPAINPKVLESALLTSLSFTREKHRNFDSVYVISGLNQTIGITAHVIRNASAGVELAPQIVAPTLTSPSSARDAGKYALGTAGIVETRTLVQPIVEGAPLLVPADLVSFKLDGTTYIGTVLSTSVSLKFNSQYQNFVVEVVKGYN